MEAELTFLVVMTALSRTVCRRCNHVPRADRALRPNASLCCCRADRLLLIASRKFPRRAPRVQPLRFFATRNKLRRHQACRLRCARAERLRCTHPDAVLAQDPEASPSNRRPSNQIHPQSAWLDFPRSTSSTAPLLLLRSCRATSRFRFVAAFLRSAAV